MTTATIQSLSVQIEVELSSELTQDKLAKLLDKYREEIMNSVSASLEDKDLPKSCKDRISIESVNIYIDDSDVIDLD